MTAYKKCNFELDSALMEATYMAEVVSAWMASAIGFENRVPPKLTEEDAAHIYWAVNNVTNLIKEADRIFRGEPEAGR